MLYFPEIPHKTIVIYNLATFLARNEQLWSHILAKNWAGTHDKQNCLLQVLDMKKTITELLTALIEESNDVNKSNVEEIKESLDQVAIYDNVIACYRLVHENVSDTCLWTDSTIYL